MTLTKTILLNADNDLDLSTGGLSLITDLDSLAQRVKVRLQTFRGECFWSPETGVPWLTQIFAGGVPKTSTLNAAIFSALSSVDGIKEIKSIDYEFDKSTRTLDISLSILSETNESLTVNVGSIV